jgi:ribonucleoside-diphosphate reductase alpha chain
MKEMANAAAKASALRAKDMGVFPKYNWENTSKSRFFQEVYTDETKELIKQYGLRNSRLLSIAPTGSISNILGVSGGVEPFFMLGYQRIIKSIFEEEKVIWVYEKTPLKLIKNLKLDNHEELPDWAKVTSQNIKFEDRAKVQATIQKYVDTAISSTFNVPNEATTEVIENIYMTA